MCDYSLHAFATRPAEVAETLVSTNFCTGTHGFASLDDPKVAVCLRPGTELAFENDVQTDGMMFRKNIGVRLARFRQIDLDKRYQHHDALEFSNGTIVLVTNLAAGQRATVLQLPASPIEEKPQASQPAARYETANV
jgi:hypothetical protein